MNRAAVQHQGVGARWWRVPGGEAPVPLPCSAWVSPDEVQLCLVNSAAINGGPSPALDRPSGSEIKSLYTIPEVQVQDSCWRMSLPSWQQVGFGAAYKTTVGAA